MRILFMHRGSCGFSEFQSRIPLNPSKTLKNGNLNRNNNPGRFCFEF